MTNEKERTERLRLDAANDRVDIQQPIIGKPDNSTQMRAQEALGLKSLRLTKDEANSFTVTMDGQLVKDTAQSGCF